MRLMLPSNVGLLNKRLYFCAVDVGDLLGSFVEKLLLYRAVEGLGASDRVGVRHSCI
jgi:hypothetical protein